METDCLKIIFADILNGKLLYTSSGTQTRFKTTCIRKEEFSDLQNIWLTGFDDLERCQKRMRLIWK